MSWTREENPAEEENMDIGLEKNIQYDPFLNTNYQLALKNETCYKIQTWSTEDS